MGEGDESAPAPPVERRPKCKACGFEVPKPRNAGELCLVCDPPPKAATVRR